MYAIVVIPSRYQSTRLPGKPLLPLLDKPMIQHVYERCAGSRRAKGVFVATDDERIADTVGGFGGRAVMTSPLHTSGTDRLAEAAVLLAREGVAADVVVNVQGDEPLIRAEMIDEVISTLDDERADIGTLVKLIREPRECFDPNVVKAVFDREGFALYFSRSPIPYHRDHFGSGTTAGKNCPTDTVVMHKHIGIYAYRRSALARFAALSPSRLEEAERLEQLRALENGMRIKVRETQYETIGVDTPMDLERVKQCLSTSS